MCFCEWVSACVSVNVFLRMCYQFAFSIMWRGRNRTGEGCLWLEEDIGKNRWLLCPRSRMGWAGPSCKNRSGNSIQGKRIRLHVSYMMLENKVMILNHLQKLLFYSIWLSLFFNMFIFSFLSLDCWKKENISYKNLIGD